MIRLCLATAVFLSCASAIAQGPDRLAARHGLEAMGAKAQQQIDAANADLDVRGTGPYPAAIEVDLALPNATIYRPANLAQMGTRKLGLIIWGNGGCSNDGASALPHLAEIASHGYLVIAPGKPLTGPLSVGVTAKPEFMRTTVQDMQANLDWALAENGRRGSPYYQRIDPGAVAVSGHSCGGIQAILFGDDPRVKTIIINNSGINPVLPDRPPITMHGERLKGLHQPVLFFFGGETDVMWKYGTDSFDHVQGVPAFMASRDLGHGGTLNQRNGGEVAKLTVDWLQWRLRGDKAAGMTFAGPACRLCKDPAWTVRKKNMP